ncbi:hypothetical protein ACLH0K_13850 [Arthrobacter sp. MPF02]|uniref:hypothetical protein n=1 Tax=Arthrobacter sp. MPF02 TaxID=3388492 RepID=UPI003984BD79
MNLGSHPEVPEDVPEADALEQRTPVQPEGSDDFGLADGLPEDASEADVLEQHLDVRAGAPGYAALAGAAEGKAAEGDLVEQVLAPPPEDEDDYPEDRNETW